ncbi:MAG: hypothetical protein LBP59_19045 [Planctomycetaceae bacterium]|nr:hypothetical protein [Planctomycetaceae bacterium]
MRLYSTANERGLYLKRLFVCLAANCRRDARDPLVSPAFRIAGDSGSQTFRLVFIQIRRRLACKRLYSTANERGLTSQRPFCLPCGKLQAGRLRSGGL